MTPLLEVEALSVRIPTDEGWMVPVEDVSVSVGSAEIVGVVGESGCGKTTLLRALAGVPARRSVITGTVRVNGVDVAPGRSAPGIAMIPQDPMTSLNPVLTVGEQITEVPRYRLGLSRSDANDLAIELLTEVGIGDAERRLGFYPHELSGGLRQRVMIAAALSGSPQLLLCDEPTTALDVTVQARFVRLLKSLVESRGIGILYVTHDLPLLGTMCDRINVMYAGQVVERGVLGPVLHRPAHPYTEALLEAAPRIETRVHRLPSIAGHPPRLLAPLPEGCRFAPRCSQAAPECAAAGALKAGPDGHDTACIRRHDLAPAGRSAS
jgi:oligopeptide/dipeptide ABC transporter ATP-binding protein